MLPVGDTKPKAYQEGYIYFYDIKFKVNENVLIPRIETEKLVDIAFEEINNHKNNRINIFDIGTGSGCISISLRNKIEKEFANTKNITSYALDISSAALEIAKQNAVLNRVGDKIKFIDSDLLNNIDVNNMQGINIVVANLPYIPTANIEELDTSVKDYEPLIALDGGKDGFEIYRKLFTQIIDKNLNPIIIAIEIDDEQGDIALEEAKKYFNNKYKSITIEDDIFKYPRFLIIK